MPTFEVEFLDGTKSIQKTSTADDAKRRARGEQLGKVPGDTPMSAPEVKIKRVTQLEDDGASESDAAKGNKRTTRGSRDE